jgi:DNA polymerase III delta subunit
MAKRSATSPATATLTGSAATPSLPRVVVLHGKDRFLQESKLAELRAVLAATHGGEGGDIDTVRFDAGPGGSRPTSTGGGSAGLLADILDECRSTGLMQQYKVVLVENADVLLKEKDAPPEAAPPPPKPSPAPKGKKTGPAKRLAPARPPRTAREIVATYCESPSDTATLVLRATTWHKGNLDKAILAIPAGGGVIHKCEPMAEHEAAQWAVDRAKQHKTKLDRDAAAVLVQSVGVDLGRIDSELEKLALAAGGSGQPITAALVRQMTGVTREEDFWVVQDLLLSGDAPGTLAKLRDLIEISRHDPVPIMWSYVEAARKLHVAASARAAGLGPQAAMAHLKVWGPPAQRDRVLGAIFAVAGKASAQQTADLLRASVEADRASKSGADPVRQLESLTMKFAAMPR